MAIVIFVSCVAVRAAEATCVAVENGCSVCCSGDDDCSTSCPEPTIDWEERPARIEVGLGAVAMSTMDLDGGAGARVSLGYHRVRAFDNLNIDHAPRPRGAWCAPLLLCGLGGLTEMPMSAIVGNERGVDVVLEHARGVGEPRTSVALRPVLRVARLSRIRTASLVGVILPEVGAAWRNGSLDGLALRWSLYPIDVRMTHLLAVSFEPIAFAATIANDTTWSMASTITVSALL